VGIFCANDVTHNSITYPANARCSFRSQVQGRGYFHRYSGNDRSYVLCRHEQSFEEFDPERLKKCVQVVSGSKEVSVCFGKLISTRQLRKF
jgi:hypothetical protein